MPFEAGLQPFSLAEIKAALVHVVHCKFPDLLGVYASVQKMFLVKQWCPLMWLNPV